MNVNAHTSVHLVGYAPRIEAYVDPYGNVVVNADDGPGGSGVSIVATRAQAAEMGRKLLAVSEPKQADVETGAAA